MSAVLYGVGLGPGDPDLMTLRAHRLIAGADVIAYPSLAGGASFARAIAAAAIRPGARGDRDGGADEHRARPGPGGL